MRTKGKCMALVMAVLLLGALPLGAQAASQTYYTFMPRVLPAEQATEADPQNLLALREGGPGAGVRNLLLDAPAGKYGFVESRDGHFYLTDTGARIKFWGVNMAFAANFPENTPQGQSEADNLAAQFAEMGINLVRLHGFDSSNGASASIFKDYASNTSELSETQLDRLDYFIYALKQRGIYVNLNLNSKRVFTSGDGVETPEAVSSGGELKPVQLFDPTLVQLQKEFAEKLLLHQNPYTGLTYAQEPAIAMIELANEVSMFSQWVDNKFDNHLNDGYETELNRQWNAWLEQKYGTSQSLSDAWYPEGSGQAPEIGSAEWLQRGQIKNFPSQAVLDFSEFMRDTEQVFYNGMRSYLRDTLGVKQPISGNNFYAGLADLSAHTDMDFTSGHAYFDHPIFPLGWSKTLFHMSNDSLVLTGAQPQNHFKNSLFGTLALTAVEGKPHVVGEWGFPYPNPHEYEAMLLAAAVGNLQDWDAMIFFAYSHDAYEDNGAIDYWFDLRNNPAKRAQMGTAALLFLRGDMAAAEDELVVNYTKEDTLQHGLQDIYTYSLFSDAELSPTMLYNTKLRRGSFEAQQTTQVTQHLSSESISQMATSKQYETANGQFRWEASDESTAFVQLNTPRLQAFVGFLSGQSLAGGNLKVEMEEYGNGAVSLVSTDGAPIISSGNLLLTVCGEQQNQGRSSNPLGGFLRWGSGSVDVAKLNGQIQIYLEEPENYTVYPLKEDGSRMQALQTHITKENHLQFATEADSMWYEIVANDLPLEPANEEIQLDTVLLQLSVGEQAVLHASHPDGTVPEDLVWQLANEGQQPVTLHNGELVANEEGVATVTVYSEAAPEYKANCVVAVQEQPYENDVSLEKESILLYNNDEVAQVVPLDTLEVSNNCLVIRHPGTGSGEFGVGMSGATIKALTERYGTVPVRVIYENAFYTFPTDTAAYALLTENPAVNFDETMVVAQVTQQQTPHSVGFSITAELPQGNAINLSNAVARKGGLLLAGSQTQSEVGLVQQASGKAGSAPVINSAYVLAGGRFGYGTVLESGVTYTLSEQAVEVLPQQVLPMAQPGTQQSWTVANVLLLCLGSVAAIVTMVLLIDRNQKRKVRREQDDE